jgi:hypothetical protein
VTNFKTIRDVWLLCLGTIGFLQQVFLAREPNYLLVGGSLAILGVAPLLRLDEARRKTGDNQ